MTAVFTIVCVLHDSAGPLAALLRSLDEHLPGTPVVAVDTGSRDGGPELASAHGATVLRLDDNPGFGAATNAGMAHVRTPVTVLLNPDCECLDAGLARLAAAAASHDSLWAPRLVGRDGRWERSAHPLPGTAGSLLPAVVHPPLLPRRLRERMEPWRSARARTVGWAVGACLAGRTETLRRLGPFDPRDFLFAEDMDLCLRARATGVPTVFDPAVKVRHLGGHSTRPVYGGEPHDVLARRRREVVGRTLGQGARRVDDLAQALTFATRAAARALLRRDSRRERAQLAAVWRAARELA
jgi:GT2 family glycosyltransferase